MAAVTYDDALTTLQSMFTEMDKEVINTVLEANHGHMENTVTCLLRMSGDETITPVNPVNPVQLEQEQRDELYARNLQNQILHQQYQYYSRPAATTYRDDYWPQHNEPDPLITWISSVGEAAKNKIKTLASKIKNPTQKQYSAVPESEPILELDANRKEKAKEKSNGEEMIELSNFNITSDNSKPEFTEESTDTGDVTLELRRRQKEPSSANPIVTTNES